MREQPEDFEMFTNEIENEYARKLDELAKIENSLRLSMSESDEELKGLLRNAMVVMLYAYFEGFCKKVFEIYVTYLNGKNEKVENVKSALAAATIAQEFDLLENPQHAPTGYGIDYKENGRLKRYARRIEFTELFSTLMDKTVSIPETILNTESNLRPEILNQILFNLAFDYRVVEREKGYLNKLVNYRNDIAHGTFSRPISPEDFNNCKSTTQLLMERIKNEAIKNYKEKTYLK